MVDMHRQARVQITPYVTVQTGSTCPAACGSTARASQPACLTAHALWRVSPLYCMSAHRLELVGEDVVLTYGVADATTPSLWHGTAALPVVPDHSGMRASRPPNCRTSKDCRKAGLCSHAELPTRPV